MITDLDELRELLQSDKPTQRKKGKTTLETEIIRKKVELNPMQTIIILCATIKYEKREIDALKSKGKGCTVDATQFFRNVMKYLLKYGQFFLSLIFCNNKLFISFLLSKKKSNKKE